MTDKKISALTDGTDFQVTDWLEITRDISGTPITRRVSGQYLADLLGGGGSVDVQEFAADGTWTKPDDATLVRVELWAAAGGGGSGRKGAAGSARSGGGGGGGGGKVTRWFKASELGSTEDVTIGAGGIGGAAQTTDSTDGNEGGDGDNTIFGTDLATATHGYGGFAGTTSESGAGYGGGVFTVDGVQATGEMAVYSSSDRFATEDGGAAGGTSYETGGADSGLNSVNGGCGGGGGAGIGVGNNPQPGQRGGTATDGDATNGNAGGGAAYGEATNPGTAGATPAIAGRIVGEGGGGGGSSGGAGGAGGRASGGGGGGAGVNSVSDSGAGGDGGNGYARITTW